MCVCVCVCVCWGILSVSRPTRPVKFVLFMLVYINY